MKISYNQKLAVAAGILMIGVFFFGLYSKSNVSSTSSESVPSFSANSSPGEKKTNSVSPAQRAVAPYIVVDTQNDSPGTNMVTRIVTFSAQIGGTPLPSLQWEVNKGNGFEAVGGATNAIYRIGNAQVSDVGFYLLFATNAAGGIQTTPQQLIVTYGED